MLRSEHAEEVAPRRRKKGEKPGQCVNTASIKAKGVRNE